MVASAVRAVEAAPRTRAGTGLPQVPEEEVAAQPIAIQCNGRPLGAGEEREAG